MYWYSTFAPHGPAAAALARLGWPVLVGFTLVSLLMWALLAWLIVRRRGSYATHAPVDSGGGIAFVVNAGFVVPAIVLAIVFVATLRSLAAFPTEHGTHRTPPHIRVTAHRWWWEVEYLVDGLSRQVTSATELHIPVGVPVDVELVSRDVIHSFWTPALHGKVDLVPGVVNRIRLHAETPGVFAGECAEYCGLQHTNMLLWVVAEPADAFNRFLTREREDAVAPADATAALGQTVFLNKACSLCHRVRGTAAQATVGPDLTHFGNRRFIDGPFPKTEAYLRAWVTHAQSLKPGVIMPSVIDLSGPELAALSAYLQQLQ